MDSSSPLHCQHCGTLNDPRSSLTGIPACASCGLTSVEGAFSMQDELSKLFERGMAFTQPLSTAPHDQQSNPSGSPAVRPALGYSASQHYVPVTRPVLSPEPDVQEQADRLPLACEQLLYQHGIDPGSLQSAQKALFLYATPDQRARLLDLWAAYSQVQGRDHEMDAAMGQHRPATRLSFDGHDTAEPYVQYGYGIQTGHGQAKDSFSPFGSAVGNKSEYRQAVDPIFSAGSQGWWRHGPQDERQAEKQPVEHQYGMFEAMRQYHIPIDDDEML